MSFDPTVSQGGPDRRRSQEMSLHGGQPPAQVPGYELESFLGEGAYGEVWVAIERNTGRRVAIKFYAHRGGLDWSLLSREVEKLAFLFADRYVVQLVGVGWDATPPYYVMEFLEKGSLAERLQQGPLPVAEAVELFRGTAVGLAHAHGKGVLHCDLKPANILLDQDGKPRLADFGQSRLSHEQVPTLGTLFYMAPEQADLKAVPDARWDVYALGALLYCMLTGGPPHRSDQQVRLLERSTDLEERLAAYRRMIRKAPPASAHREVPGVDRALAEIVDRCLAADPARRYPNVQAVLDALDARAARRAMRPMMILGAVGPALLLLVVSVFAWQGANTAVRRSEQALVQRALDDNRLIADYVAGLAAMELQRRYDAVEQVANSPQLVQLLGETIEKPGLGQMMEQLSDPGRGEKELEPLREKFRADPDRLRFQKQFEEQLIPSWMEPPKAEGGEEAGQVASWFFCDARGLSTVRVPQGKTIGKNFAWRSFFHGGDRDQPDPWRPKPGEHLARTGLSAVFKSQASNAWIVAVMAPVLDRRQGNKFLGVVALTVRVNRFVQLEGKENLFAVLVELRPGDHTGMILQHRLFDTLRPAPPGEAEAQRPDLWQEYRRRVEEYRADLQRFQDYRLTVEALPNTDATRKHYRDPLSADPKGTAYDRRWLAQIRPVEVRGTDAGWAVIVQEAYDSTIGSTLARLRSSLIGYGLAAVALIVLVLFGQWGSVFRLLGESAPYPGRGFAAPPTERPATPATPRGPTETRGSG